MTSQTATLPTESRSNGRNRSPEKELVGTMSLIGSTERADESPVELASVRFYMARRSDGASPVYCSVWLRYGCYSAGNGTARGYGYHKRSAALQEALDSAGVTLAEPIDGRGDGAMEEALQAIARASGYHNAIVVTHA